jgi:GTP diphosphokinase / guanosine-3',5'-bis(diphosphate) 3'-diphosphatase
VSIAADITRAALFAAQRHAGQRRKGSAEEPYFNHLVEVADLLAQAVGDSDVNLIIAGFLHDTVEDVGVTREELRAEFGDDVAALVDAVTDDKSLPKPVRKQLQIEHAPRTSVRAQWLKMADKTSNLRSLRVSPPATWSMERRIEYVAWARAVVDRLPQPHPWLKAQFDEAAASAIPVSDARTD